MGFLGPGDRVVMSTDHLLAEAKAEVLRMAEEGYRPPDVTGNIYAAGRDYLANLRVGIHMMREARYITAHEAIIADQLAYVLCGGVTACGGRIRRSSASRPGWTSSISSTWRGKPSRPCAATPRAMNASGTC